MKPRTSTAALLPLEISSTPRMSASLLALLACASGLSVANVYYAQPLLDAIAADFSITRAAIGGVVTATQVGCALALIFLVPLGDLVSRRRLMLMQALALVAALALVTLSNSAVVLLIGMLATGLFGTAMTQGLIAYAASAAGDTERGHVVGTTQAGVFIGLLLARVVSGGVSDVAGWRGIYGVASVAMLILATMLYRALPDIPTSSSRMSYPRLLSSLLGLLRDERVLRIRGTLAFLMFAVFNVFWSALVLPLSEAPYRFSHTIIGAFGLVGALGALAAGRAGRWADRGLGERATGWAMGLLVVAWLPLASMHASLWWLALGIVLLDASGQIIHVTNQSLILRRRPDAHGRLIGVYMLFYATGSGAGAMATTAVYARFEWVGVCALGAAVGLAALLFWVATVDRAELTRAKV
ncbi:MFS transporter [Luteibacter sp. NPDC031894]|uniref:MFS transporter n=1 Tax=Luteibacter sp. NPDC031894 TaxID=3390572 RepID=UPI003CFDBD82